MTEERSAKQEWASNWALVLTSLVGVSLGTIGIYSAGLFVAPLEAEFGWTRSQVTSGLLIYSLIAVPLSPFVGMAIDRWGARSLAIPGSIATGLTFAGFALTNGSAVIWWTTWALFSLAALTVKTTVWATAVAAVFKRGRGLALAVALSGTGLASAVIPMLAQHLISDFGWRTAYVAIGLGWAVITALPSYFFFVDVRGSTTDGPRPDVPGLVFREAIRLRSFQQLWVVVLLGSLLLVGMTVHLVPILSSLGFDRGRAAAIAGVFGIATVTGKLVSGFVFDRWSPKLAAAIFQALPILACALLLQAKVDTYSAIAAVFLIGYSSGAALTMASFLTAKLVGLKAYGMNFSIMASIFALAAGVGPLLCSIAFDWDHSYRPVLLVGLGVPAICSLLLARIKL
ncbi:MAG: MFS transporter [Pseudomonadota bacterium]